MQVLEDGSRRLVDMPPSVRPARNLHQSARGIGEEAVVPPILTGQK
jgi:hypothetical protein